MLKVHRKSGELLLEDGRKGDASWLRVTLPSNKAGKSGENDASYKPIVDLEEVARVKDDNDEPPLEMEALYGVYSLLSGPYLAFIKKSRMIGKGPNDEHIYQLLEMEFVPVSQHAERHFQSSASKQEKRDQQIYLNMLKTVGKCKMFYYSFDYHMTLSAQRHALLTSSATKLPAHARADESFFWNKPVLEPFLRSKLKLDRWIVPVINGFVKIARGIQVAPDAAPVDFYFFTRRSWHRVGTRFNVRGVDKDGHCANFAETEMLVRKPDGGICSYVQVRGSIPLYWDQMVTLKYMPRTRYANSTTDLIDWNELAFRAHFDNVIAKYGHITVLNLIDKNGKSSIVRDQNQLGSAFQKYTKKYNQNQGASNGDADDKDDVPASPPSLKNRKASGLRESNSSTTLSVDKQTSLFAQPIQYIWFDFHDECRNMKYQNLGKLMDMAAESFAKYDWFEADADGRVLKKQKGVFRVNCMDNLDRTNVVMSLVARRCVLQFLRIDTKNLEWLDSPFPAFETYFKNVWADNADAVSVMYAGTGALKTDFTRTGKRTIWGAIQDGINSVTRYYLNNFRDGILQDSLDLFVGNFTADRRTDSPFTVQQQNSFAFLVAKVVGIAAIVTGISLSLHWSEDVSVRIRDGLISAVAGLALLGYLLLKKGSFRSIGRHCVCKPAFCSTGYIRKPENK